MNFYEKYLARFNPCDIASPDWFAKIFGDPIAKVWKGFTCLTDCPCCLGWRLVISWAIMLGLGYWLCTILN